MERNLNPNDIFELLNGLDSDCASLDSEEEVENELNKIEKNGKVSNQIIKH